MSSVSSVHSGSRNLAHLTNLTPHSLDRGGLRLGLREEATQDILCPHLRIGPPPSPAPMLRFRMISFFLMRLPCAFAPRLIPSFIIHRTILNEESSRRFRKAAEADASIPSAASLNLRGVFFATIPATPSHHESRDLESWYETRGEGAPAPCARICYAMRDVSPPSIVTVSPVM